MSLPFFDVLIAAFPHSRIDIIAKNTIQDVFLHHPAIHTIHSFSKKQVHGVLGLYRYGKHVRTLGVYDLFITLAPSFSSAFIGYSAGCRFRIGYRREARSWMLTHSFSEPQGIHRTHVFCDLLRLWLEQLREIPNSLPFPVPQFPNVQVQTIRFPFSAQEQQTIFLPKTADSEMSIVFNVNSEAQSRRLPLEKWIELGNRLLEDQTRRRKLVFVGAPGEEPRVQQVVQGIRRQEFILNYAGKTSIRQFAMLLRDADLVVTNDSGPMHLANAVGAPMVTFIGAADPVETEPFNRGNALVINKQLACSPCVKNVCKFSTVRCLEQISVEEIYQASLKLLQKSGDS
ncbi:hypothetical protein U27_06759 [Candidatus Vecturithrix granuli]|uniref:Lipopolysaccharide heptosyltransferase II n=1 Tax=Vecturithrix granuli TaxID=1499967 RepID=A0A081C5B9_VECG1|nr:hypothetical protein U27_06759 [Candidatus Vecturithrix granuli]